MSTFTDSPIKEKISYLQELKKNLKKQGLDLEAQHVRDYDYTGEIMEGGNRIGSLDLSGYDGPYHAEFDIDDKITGYDSIVKKIKSASVKTRRQLDKN